MNPHSDYKDEHNIIIFHGAVDTTVCNNVPMNTVKN